MKKLALFLSILFAVSAFAGCSGKSGGSGSASDQSAGSSGKDSETINIVVTDNGWDSQMLHNEIARLVVEHAYDGYTFETSTASSTINWQSLIKGEIDLDIESWTENVNSYQDDLANGDVIEMGVLVPDGQQGVYVPRYVIEGDPERDIEPMAPELKSVEDLKKYPDVFPDDEEPEKGRLFGAVPGWMADEILEKKYHYYGLDETFEYRRLGSEASLFSSLESAYNLGQAWAGYCYEPSWIAGRLDIVKLEDAPYEYEKYINGECEYPSQELMVISSGKFAKRAPELVGFFENYQTGSELISSALSYLDETHASHEEVAVWVLKENDELIDQWLPGENAEKLRDYLAEL